MKFVSEHPGKNTIFRFSWENKLHSFLHVTQVTQAFILSCYLTELSIVKGELVKRCERTIVNL